MPVSGSDVIGYQVKNIDNTISTTTKIIPVKTNSGITFPPLTY